MLSSAVSEYVMSHGRNLLKKNHKNFRTNCYSDPYCRVWTFHNQYHRLADTIRPLMDGEKTADLSKTVIGCKYQINRQRLDKYGVKGNNGLVRYSPISEDGVNSIKKCMFSIENLAWKRESIDKTDQVGPLGGRIMWFPPYGLSFSEAVNVSWNPTQFIGRGENIYTYTNTERSGTLQFKLLIDHPSLLNEWRNDNEKNDSLDDDSLEQKVLRFFAGCEILDPCQKNKKAVKKKIQPTPVVVKQEPIMIENKTYSNIVFYVFYPNNYSGADDNANGVVKPMEYLMYGIGPQKIEVNGKVVDYGTIVNDSNGIGYEVSSSGISSVFAKTNGSAVTYSDECKLDGYKFVSYSSKNKVGKQNKWYYRVDKQFENEVFRNNLSYKDTKSFSLNGSGYASLVNYHTDAKPLLETNELFSFKDVFMALNQDNSNSDNITYLRNLIKDYDVYSVEVQGFASSHGYDENNNILNKNRAQSVIDWLNKCNPIKFDKSKCKIIKTKIGPKLTHNDASSIEAKVWRCSKVVIKLEKEELVEVKNLNNDNDAIKISNNIQTKSQQVSNEVTNVMDISLKSAYNYLYGESNKKIEQVVENSSSELSDGNINRYGNEHEFFQELKVNAPFLHNKIVDKIKYFDPAYHSITPEGFNARLTFLHQCTRQGSTTSSSSKHGNRTASNLSFGAPPICVLRVGDFYNTKILIDSLNITYDDLTWDLNDEGIGVMPMIADISIGFKFLGGSDLSGPIARLQNAVSFNYYANTNVYDDRADTVEYDENGNISEYNAKI